MAHTWPSLWWPFSWKYTDYDGFGNIMKHLLENLPTNPVSSVTLLTDSDSENYVNGGVLRKFSQKEFAEEGLWETDGLAEYGMVWIPNYCLTN